MYFKFFISESWGKRAAIARSRFIQSFLRYKIRDIRYKMDFVPGISCISYLVSCIFFLGGYYEICYRV